jgi:hypothetical protein
MLNTSFWTQLVFARFRLEEVAERMISQSDAGLDPTRAWGQKASIAASRWSSAVTQENKMSHTCKASVEQDCSSVTVWWSIVSTRFQENFSANPLIW